ncbi:MAG: hypothetical protein Q9222_007019 [Ikaeria aurantiellina]
MDEAEPEDKDITVQKDSKEKLHHITTSLPFFLWKRNSSRAGSVRRYVRQRHVSGYVEAFDYFQEWPQLLDPILENIVRSLVSAFLEFLQHYPADYSISETRQEEVLPLPRAVCKLLYTLCKVRGTKVISRFFSNEPANLEVILDALDGSVPVGFSFKLVPESTTWEEKYVMLLWLAHLTLAPFSLATISSTTSTPPNEADIPLETPASLPMVAHRLLSHSFRFISSAGKERDAAVQLLVRLSLRPDMQNISLHQQCIRWALDAVKSLSRHASVYSQIGTLSFIAGFLRSGNDAAVAPFISSIVDVLQELIAVRTEDARSFLQSAVVRKLIVKIYRSLAIHSLSATSFSVDDEINPADLLGDIFDQLLHFLGDKDNPVRFASSKALSIISRKLDLEMTEQLVDAITESLQENITESTTQDEPMTDSHAPYVIKLRYDFSTADAMEWHGLTLTLAHLLFRRSAPVSRLITIINLLVRALHFHQASSVVASRDATVRDAACFGIWSLARKYSTTELLQIPTETVRPGSRMHSSKSAISMLAAELTATATLDPEGNIRRGASAALQELVGRHPDSVPFGIPLIQLVDYHAIGLRKRAMLDISVGAAAFGEAYLDLIFEALLSWRALASSDRRARCDAAISLAIIVEKVDLSLIHPLVQKFNDSKSLSIEERHGLSLALAWSLDQMRTSELEGPAINCVRDGEAWIYSLTEDAPFADHDMTEPSSRRNLVIEAQCEMTNTLLMFSSGRCLDGPMPAKLVLGLRELRSHRLLLEMSLNHAVEIDMQTLVRPAKSLCDKLTEDHQVELLHDWLTTIEQGSIPSGSASNTWIAVTGSVLGCLEKSQKSSEFANMLSLARKVLISQLSKGSRPGSKVVSLDNLFMHVYDQCWFLFSLPSLMIANFGQGSAHGLEMTQIDQALLDCLDDYTITAQGDVGSTVRIQALKMLNARGNPKKWSDKYRMQVFGRICGLAVEKLDKVRPYAWAFIRCQGGFELPWSGILSVPEHLAVVQSPDVECFTFILNISNCDPLRYLAMRGFVTSAGFGHDDLVHTARTALVTFLDSSSAKDKNCFYQTLIQLIRSEPYDGRLTRPSLEVLAFLLEYMDIRLEGDTAIDTWQGLLSHLPSLHKSTDIPTLEAVVRIYAASMHHVHLKDQAYSAILRLLLHRYIAIRLAAASALWLDQPNGNSLKALDMNQQVPALRQQIKAMVDIGRQPRRSSLGV